MRLLRSSAAHVLRRSLVAAAYRRTFYGAAASFADLGLPAEVATALSSAGLDRPTAVQEQAIPVLQKLSSSDDGVAGGDRVAVVVAETGSGKTVAYLAPIAAGLVGPDAASDRRTWRALVLCPNAALCAQVRDAARGLFATDVLDVAVLSGSAPPRANAAAGERPLPQLAIATPRGPREPHRDLPR